MADISEFVKRANSGTFASAPSFQDPRDAIFAQDELRRKKQTMQQPKPQSGGIVGFLQSAGRSLGSDFARVGQGTANVIHELTGGAQKERDIQNKSDQEDIAMIKSLGQRLKNAKTDEEKRRYRDAIGRISTTGDEQSKRFVETQNQIAEQNDPLKGAASVAGIGLDVLGAGTGASVLGGGLKQAIGQGLKQGAIYGGAQGALQPVKEKGGGATAEDIGGGALVGAGLGSALGGVTGATTGVLGKILNRNTTQGRGPSLKKLGSKIERAGNDLLGTQANLTRAESRINNFKPSDVMGSINKRTGLSSMDDMAEVGKNLTGEGENSLLDTITRSAVGESKGVDVGDLRKIAQTSIDNGGSVLSKNQRKQILDNMTQAGVTMRGGSQGSLSSLADPGKALDQANVFRSTARDLTKGLNVSAEQRQQAKIYNQVARQIEDAIYNSPGVGESLPLLKKAGVDDLLFKAADATSAGNKAQAKAYKQLANELGEVKDIAQLRKMKRDFVDLSKIDEATARAQSGAGAQLGDNMQGLGKLFQRPSNLLAVPLNAMTPKTGSWVAKAGRMLKGDKINQDSLNLAFNPAPGEKALNGTTRDALGSLINPTVSRLASVAPNQSFETSGQPVESSNEAVIPELSGSTSEQTSGENGLFTEANIQNLILQDLQGNDGKNIDKLIKLYETFGKGSTASKTTAKQQESKARANAGLSALDQIEDAFTGAGGGQGFLGNLTNAAGSLKLNPQAEAYNRIRNSAISLIARGLGGSAQGSDRDRADIEQALPSLTDSPEAARIKIKALRDRLAAGSLSAVPDNEYNDITQGAY